MPLPVLHCKSEAWVYTQKLGSTQEQGAEEEHSVDDDLVHPFMLATRKSCICYYSSTPALEPPNLPIPMPHCSASPIWSYFPDIMSEFTGRDCQACVQGEPHAFTKSNSAFPSCRTSNSMSPPGHWYPCCHLVKDYLGQGFMRYQGRCEQIWENHVF